MWRQMASRTPDFFLVGAPKCGTTALNDYLAAHPEVFMCPRKESHHFCADWSPHYLSGRAEYLALFAAARDEKRLGESSVWHFYAPRAAAAIRQFCPAAQIIVMLRNPLEMIHALHAHRLFIASEDLADFSDALAAEPARRRGEQLPAWPHPIPGLFYRELTDYAPHLARFFDTFGRERVRVIIYDDFRADTARAYRETCAWLGVDDGFAPEFRVVNAAKRVRSRTLRAWLDDPPALLRRLGHPFLTQPARHNFLRRLRRLNTRHVPRPPLDESLRRALQDEFRPAVERLSALLNRDLTHWCRTL